VTIVSVILITSATKHWAADGSEVKISLCEVT
jgi:hypothetical protein